MPKLTMKQQQLAWKIHATVQDLAEKGNDDTATFTDISQFMPQFKRLFAATRGNRGAMDELHSSYPGFSRYATIFRNQAIGATPVETNVRK